MLHLEITVHGTVMLIGAAEPSNIRVFGALLILLACFVAVLRLRPFLFRLQRGPSEEEMREAGYDMLPPRMRPKAERLGAFWNRNWWKVASAALVLGTLMIALESLS